MMPHPRWQLPGVPFRSAHVPVAHSTIRRARDRGDLIGLGGGVMLDRDAWPEDPVLRHALLALAWQLRRPSYVASHETAALLNRLPLPSTQGAAVGSPRFTQPPAPGSRGRSKPQVAVRELPATAVLEVAEGRLSGLRYTSPARTAVDLAVELHCRTR